MVDFRTGLSLQNDFLDYRTDIYTDFHVLHLSPFFFSQCSSALKYLHKHHIIYRDLKSENVLVWSFPVPHSPNQGTCDVLIKLADYGISRSAAMAGMKGLGGTPGFMAPEIEKYVGKECYTEKVRIRY